jgi:heptosyltransferase-2
VNGPRKLLVVGPSWVGDMVLAQTLYTLLRERDAALRIDVVAPAWSLPLLERMPEVERGIELAVAHGELGLGKRMHVARRLAREGYERAIVLPRSLKAALVPFLARVPVRTGFRGEARYGLINDMRPFDPKRLDQTVKRFVALGLGVGTPAVALMPGAEYGPAKRWPVERFAALAARLVAAGLEVWVLGSQKERELGRAIEHGDERGRIRNLCGETRLEEAVDVLAASTAAVTNDSGLMHVAAAVGTHVVAIYGSSSPDFTPPMTQARTIIRVGIECSPCFERECPLGHLRCLRDIGVDTVLAATLAAVGARTAAGAGGDARPAGAEPAERREHG